MHPSADGLRPGDALGDYRIERLLRRGAIGALYLATEPATHQPVVLKTLALAAAFDDADGLDEARRRFAREAQTAGRLRHADIVRVWGSGEDRGIAYIVMEPLSGADLGRYTRRARLLPEPLVLEVAARVADALAHAHAHGVIHRDVKPANVMVDWAQGLATQVKVTDFGIARTSDSARTRTGLVLGTPCFMSPEQLAGLPADGRSDLYSLGVMLFQLLTARLPYEGASIGALLHAMADRPAERLAAVRPELPSALGRLLEQLMQQQVAARPPDGRVVAAELRSVAAAWPEPRPPAG